MLEKAKKKFPFRKDDVVLAKYGNELYYAKILSINYKRKYAKLLFDDGSKEEVGFKKIFSGKPKSQNENVCLSIFTPYFMLRLVRQRKHVF